MKKTYFDVTANVTLLDQVTNFIQKNIENGTYKKGEKLLSINAFSKQYGVSRDTIEKAYVKLKDASYIIALAGKGFYVATQNDGKINVLLVFNKLSYYKQVVYNSFVNLMAPKANVDLHIHHYNPATLAEIINKNLGKYHYYVIMPHFYQNSQANEYMPIIHKIPKEQLILLDKKLTQMPDQKGVFQDFRADIHNALLSVTGLIEKYNELVLVFPAHNNHPTEIIEGVDEFCQEKKLAFNVINDVQASDLSRGKVFIVLTESHLAQLIKLVRQSNFILGKDLGVISFNETVFKELLDITVISTNFQEMGEAAANLVLNNENKVLMNPFKIISRNSL